MNPFRAFGKPAIRVEAEGVVEAFGASVGHPLHEQQGLPLAKSITAELEILQQLPSNRIDRREEAHRFFDDPLGRLESGVVVCGRTSAAKHGDRLFMHACLDLWISRQQVHGVGKRNRSGLMASQEERDALVPELLVAHSRASLVLRAEKGAEEITAVLSALATLFDDLRYDSIHVPHGSSEPPHSWGGPPVGGLDGALENGVVEITDDLEGITDLSGSPANVRVKQGASDDVQRELGHPFVDGDLLTTAPIVEGTVGSGYHGIRICSDSPRRECMRDQFSLTPPEVGFARHEPETENASQGAGKAVFAHGGVTLRETLLDERRIEHERVSLEQQRQIDQWAILGSLCHEVERVAHHAAKVAETKAVWRPRRSSIPSHVPLPAGNNGATFRSRRKHRALLMDSNQDLPHVVILGGGFGGLAAARTLASGPVRVTLVDRSNHHLFQPLLYQVATALLPAPNIAAPLRNLLSEHANVRVLLAEAQQIDVERRFVLLDHAEPLGYDHLIVATGLRHDYFGHPEWENHAPGLKTLYEALEIRNRVLLAFEAAERLSDPEAKRMFLTFVVVGGGATGVELAGQLAEISRNALRKDFRTIDPSSARIVLVEGAERIFGDYKSELSERARRDLESIGVEVRTSSFVTGIDESGVNLDDHERIEAHTVLWAAGVRASSLTAQLGAELDGLGRVKVTPYCTVPGHDEVAVIGDLICFPSEKTGKPLPAVAQVALQSGRLVAKNILRSHRGEAPEHFRYFDKGLMATIGRNRAIVQSGRFKMTGFAAWLTWLFIHIAFLVGFRNRVSVFFQWVWAYVTNDRASRVVFSDPKEQGSAALEPRISRRPSAAEQVTEEAGIPAGRPSDGWPWARSDD